MLNRFEFTQQTALPVGTDYASMAVSFRSREAMRIRQAITNNASVFCLLVVVGLAGALDVVVAKKMSPTYDEPQSVAYGEQVLHRHTDRSDPCFNSKAPVAALNALPKVLAGHFKPDQTPSSIEKILTSIRFARLASVFATLLLNVFVYYWARELYGTVAAVAVSILVVFSPNLIAHGTLANNDGYFALGVVGSLLYFRRYLLGPTLRNAWLSGISLALAQLTKVFALYLYIVVLILLLFALNRSSLGPKRLTKQKLIAFLAIALTSFLLIINAGFCFDRSFTPLKSFHFDSKPFLRLQKVPILRSIPLPLPYAFLQGIDMLKYHDDTGLTYGKIYLLGELRDPYAPSFHNFKSYYAVAIFFKEPIAVQILFLMGVVWILRNRSSGELIASEGVLLAAATFLFLWFSLFRNAQLGIRSILPVLAIELIIAGAAFSNFAEKTRRSQVVLGLLVLWTCISTMSYYPDLISYMNEFVYDRKHSYKILVDSNLDFGQESDLVRDYVRRNPDVTVDPKLPVAGKVLVTVNRLVGDWRGYEPMYWLLRYEPRARVGYGHLLFVVPAQDISGEQVGLPEHAR